MMSLAERCVGVPRDLSNRSTRVALVVIVLHVAILHGTDEVGGVSVRSEQVFQLLTVRIPVVATHTPGDTVS